MPNVRHTHPEAPAIPRFVSIRQAALALDIDPKYCKGYAECLGIRLELQSSSLMMTHDDFVRLARRIQSSPTARGAARRPRRPAQSAVSR